MEPTAKLTAVREFGHAVVNHPGQTVMTVAAANIGTAGDGRIASSGIARGLRVRTGEVDLAAI